MIYAILIGGFLVLFALGVPAAFAMGIIAIVVVLVSGNVPLSLLASRMTDSVDHWAWIAIPLFVLTGYLMNSGGITSRLINFSRAIIGHVTGSLSHVTVLTNTMMAGMSGSAIADASASGSILIPAMIKEGYARGHAAGIVSASCIIGPLIPPSIPFIIFGTLTGTSIVRLFLAGAVPGLMVSGVLLISGYWLSKRRKYPKYERAPVKIMAKTAFASLPALALPVIIIGGMRAGQFTATEASAIAVVYAVLVGWLLYRELNRSKVMETLVATVKTSSAVMFVIAASGAFGIVLTVYQIGPTVGGAFLSITHSPLAFLVASNILILALGCAMELAAVQVIFIPLLAPIAASFGIDPVHYGVVFTLSLLIGVMTPPYGLSMFLTCRFAECGVSEFVKGSWVFLMGLFLILILVTLFPQLSLFLPNLIMG